MQPTFKIGIWVYENEVPQDGGAFSYTQKLYKGLDAHTFPTEMSLHFVGFNLKAQFNKPTISLPYKESFYQKRKANLLHKLFGIHTTRKDLSWNSQTAKKLLKENEIEVLFYAKPQIGIDDFPYVITSWDIGHRSMYAFPEVSMNGTWINRENSIELMLNQALLISCESEQGKLELQHFYRIHPNRIHLVPLFPGVIVSEETIAIQPDWISPTDLFFIYPAQFWAHKNHYNLIMAFHSLVLRGVDSVKLILTGGDKGNMAYIETLIKNLGLEEKVLMKGFVDTAHLKWLYVHTKGLIFPSFLGPTNMPLLEAQRLGCPIACSNLPGHKEQLGENAMYFEPDNQEEITNCMSTFLANAPIKQLELTPNGTFNLANSIKQLELLFTKTIKLRRTWGKD